MQQAELRQPLANLVSELKQYTARNDGVKIGDIYTKANAAMAALSIQCPS
ncbi:hypothetical protein GCM10009827_058290 [Dactylosporangium maewongense]|uniref:Uncharacterized protein n=1 Tax=Dactylosporangium maewongense TaxID=634393 RepID=A0ABP4LXK9_9ACTN